MKNIFIRLIISVIVWNTAVSVQPSLAQIPTVSAIHKYINQRWGITIETDNNETNLVSMHYLMQLVDISNENINKIKTSDYANDSKYSTTTIVSATAAKQAIDTLIQPIDYQFFFVPATSDNTYSFKLSAGGTYYIDWGDGTIEQIERDIDITDTVYSHTYSDAASNHEIGLAGTPTRYAGNLTAAISFYDGATGQNNKYQIKSMRGCLGCIFREIKGSNTTSCPLFYFTFAENVSLVGEIPKNLFGGFNCPTQRRMFSGTFQNCAGLTGSIPENLFSGLSGAPQFSLFGNTFYGCSGLTGEIPENLFKGIKGAPEQNLFSATFSGCSGLSGNIPANLFAGISGAPAINMFGSTFKDCSGLTGSIPENLFGTINGAPIGSMYSGTFSGCSGLTGEIPDKLFGIFDGAPQQSIFRDTFNGCSGLTGNIPPHLFDGLDTTAEYEKYMFTNTFKDCINLTGPSAKIDDKYLYEIWPLTNINTQGTYTNDTQLDDYDNIPASWK